MINHHRRMIVLPAPLGPSLVPLYQREIYENSKELHSFLRDFVYRQGPVFPFADLCIFSVCSWKTENRPPFF